MPDRRPASAWFVTLVTMAVLSCSAASALAADDGPDPDPPHPVLPADPAWVRPAMVAVAGLFAAAAVVGPVVWLRARNLVPAAATHEEDPAADRH